MIAGPRGRYTSMLSVLLLGALAGCGATPPTPPETHPVSGRVLTPDRKPMAGGTLEFRSIGPETPTSLAEIKPDGTFALQTVFDGRRIDGAIAGEFRATVFPPGQDPTARPMRVPGLIVVKRGAANVFELRVEAPANSK